MRKLFSSVSALVAIAFAATLAVPAVAADVNMAGVTYIIFNITQDKNTDFHTKGIGVGKGVYLPEDGANPLANGMADFDLVFHFGICDHTEDYVAIRINHIGYDFGRLLNFLKG